jgi:Mg2+-importing ATPase
MGADPTPELDALLAHLATSARGLSSSEAAARLGRARRPRHRGAAMRIKLAGAELAGFLRASAHPLVIILLFAGAASALVGELRDAVIIGLIVLLSAGIHLQQTLRSDRAAKRLTERITPTATVLRDGAWRELARVDLVEGDIIRLSAGDLVPADARLLSASDLHVQQAALTGEPFPAEKASTDAALDGRGPSSTALVFLGTSIVSGAATAVVFAAGADTEFGEIVERLGSRPEETELERGARRFGVLILETVVVLVLFVLVVNVSLGRDALESLLFSVALAVGLTPELLPMISGVTLAQGAVAMAREKVIVKHLAAIQNLGSIDILCSDKTGTLTAGTMSLEASLDPFGTESNRPLALGFLNATFESGIASPLDAAIRARVASDGARTDTSGTRAEREPTLASDAGGALLEGFRKVDELPFDFERRRVSVVVERDGTRTLVTKGAPESVLGVSAAYELEGAAHPLDEAAAARCIEVFRGLSARGLRVLAVAHRDVSDARSLSVGDERGLVFAGLLTFSDHVVEGIAESIAELGRDGVEVKILTGDDELVSRHLCELVGIDTGRRPDSVGEAGRAVGGLVVLGAEVDRLDLPALGRVAERARLFARVSPAQKHRIVRALKARGHVVGFLGDGINDAPSLHEADVGISVAGAVDVAREASDIVLLERRLDVLHAGILEGRRAFGNVFKYLLMGTSSNFGNMLSMAAAALFLPFLPMLPTQILLNNLLYDLAQLTIPTDRVDPAYLARPQRWDISLIRRFMLRIGPASSLFDLLTFGVLLGPFHMSEAGFQTGWFLESLATQVLVLFVIRTAGPPWSSLPSVALAVTALGVVALGAALPYTPLAPWLGMVPLAPAYLAFVAVVVPSYLMLVEVAKRRLLGRAFLGPTVVASTGP